MFTGVKGNYSLTIKELIVNVRVKGLLKVDNHLN